MIRREFLTGLGMAGVGTPFLVNQLMMPQVNKKVPMGIILNTVRQEMKTDFEGTLKKLKAYGYQYLEGSYQGPSAKAYKQITDALDLRCIAGGGSMSNLQKDLDSYLKTAEILEYEYIVCYYPWLTGNDGIDIPASYKAAENLNQIGKAISDSGFKFAWHHHNWEFIPRENGTRPFDIIMQNTDPEFVSLEMDLYWVFKGGGDAIEEIKRYPGRTKMFHVKDMSKNADEEIVCVGDGKLNFKPILDYALTQGIEYWFVENETPSSSITCAKNAIDHLKKIY
jgi:sugar phosphate isomerase/epimerase